MKRVLIVLLIVTLNSAFSSFAQGIDKLVEAFAGRPEIKSVKISPDGDKLLMLQLHEGKYILVTKSLENPDQQLNGIPLSGGEYIWAEWANNGRIVSAITHDNFVKYGGYATLHDSLISMNWDGSDQVNLAYKRSRNSWFDLSQGSVLDWLKNDPDHIFVSIVGDIYKLNILTNEFEAYHRLKLKEGSDYVLDHNGVLRYIRGREKQGGFRNVDLYRKNETSEWQRVFQKEPNIHNNPLEIEGFTDNPSVLYMSKNDKRGFRGLFLYDVDSKEIIKNVSPKTNRIIHDFDFNKDGELYSYGYFEDFDKIEYLDEIELSVANIINKNFKNSAFKIINTSTDKQKFILFITSPVEPGSYYLLDRSSNKLEMLGYIYQGVDIEKLSDMRSISITSRDGFNLQGFLSLPKSLEQKNLPAIVLVRSSVKAVNKWRFDPTVQFLTAQGYAVLQINFRGSIGYGEEFEKLGKNEWGDKILNDINDGAVWLGKQNEIDAAKICIMGKNYGGYAALQATIKNPALYRCTVSNNAITNLKVARGSKAEFEDYKKIGLSFIDVSPFFHIEKFKSPVLFFDGPDVNRPVTFKNKMLNKKKTISFIRTRERYKVVDQSTYFKETSKFLEKNLQN